MRADCNEVTSFDGGFIVGIQCINIPSVDGYIGYSQFDSVASMNASYQSDVGFFAPDAQGTSCQTGPSEVAYTIGGTPSGRLVCADYEEGLIAFWTHEGYAINSTLVLFEGTYPDLYGIWLVAGPDPAESPITSPTSSQQTVTWSTTASDHGGAVGQRFVYSCPAGGSAATIWGTDVYTDDSSVCTAAAHAGLITLASGGQVTIEMRPGQEAYPATERNGVTSSPWGSWDSSFVFVAP